MPTTKLNLLKITLSGATAANSNNAQVTVTNTANGESIIRNSKGASQIVIDLNNFTTAPATGDVFTIVTTGAAMGGNIKTLTASDAQSVTVTVADFTPPAINM